MSSSVPMGRFPSMEPADFEPPWWFVTGKRKPRSLETFAKLGTHRVPEAPRGAGSDEHGSRPIALVTFWRESQASNVR